MTELKNTHYDQLIVPNTFYCTFMEGIGQQTALELKKIPCSDGHVVDIKPAKNPSDILWLNRGVPRKQQYIRGIFVIFFILLIVGVVYFVFTLELTSRIYINYRANPPDVVCSELIKSVGYDRVRVLAVLEYEFLKRSTNGLNNLLSKISQTGALPCFCEYEAD